MKQWNLPRRWLTKSSLNRRAYPITLYYAEKQDFNCLTLGTQIWILYLYLPTQLKTDSQGSQLEKITIQLLFKKYFTISLMKTCIVIEIRCKQVCIPYETYEAARTGKNSMEACYPTSSISLEKHDRKSAEIMITSRCSTVLSYTIYLSIPIYTVYRKWSVPSINKLKTYFAFIIPYFRCM